MKYFKVLYNNIYNPLIVSIILMLKLSLLNLASHDWLCFRLLLAHYTSTHLSFWLCHHWGTICRILLRRTVEVIVTVLMCSVVSDSCDLMDCSLPGSSVLGILEAMILKGVGISSSWGIFLVNHLQPCGSPCWINFNVSRLENSQRNVC